MNASGSFMLYVGSRGMEDPTRAGLLFAAAKAAAEHARNNNLGTEIRVALLGDAVFLVNQKIAENTKPAGRASVKELMDEAVKKWGVKVYC